MDRYQEVYSTGAQDYDELVSREDYQGNILAELRSRFVLAELDVIETSAGTGRLTCLLASEVRKISAFEGSAHMLELATAKLRGLGRGNWTTAVADNAALPARSHEADLCIAGWGVGHCVGWFPDTWRERAGRALDEMSRVTRSGGSVALLETLGTGHETPFRSAALAPFYAWLEDELGFSNSWFRTDYRFETPEVATRLTRRFFGDGLADRIERDGLTILPECTGLWWRVE